jgi:peptidoglycan hydrolase-like protein with peptidoglycan-binding domain
MARLLFGPGMRGDLAARMQEALTAAGFGTRGVDGIFGNDTVRALRTYQVTRRLTGSDEVDTDCWSALTGKDVPTLFERVLGLTAAIEGHGYDLALGNWDGAWLTWGIVGFTLKHGEVSRIVLSLEHSAPDLIERAFGAHKSQLLAIMQSEASAQRRWADSITLGNGGLTEPWRSGFRVLGSFAATRELQRERARISYYEPARVSARKLGLSTELGLSLCFDIHVQNGSVGEQLITQALAQLPRRSQPQLRAFVANAVADRARAEYRADVRTRKLAIANGEGVVHGLKLRLARWGLAELEVA